MSDLTPMTEADPTKSGNGAPASAGPVTAETADDRIGDKGTARQAIGAGETGAGETARRETAPRETASGEIGRGETGLHGSNEAETAGAKAQGARTLAKIGAPAKERILILEAGRAERNYWSDLWAYRELFAILAWRDVAVQYKQSVIGVAWAVVRPLLTMIIFTIIFGRLAKLPSEGTAPYPVMVMTGMLAWFLVSTILNNSSNSLVTNSNLIGKVYFPRLIIPAASGIVAIIDFGFSFIVLAAMMVFFGYLPDWRIAFLPLFVLLALLAALGPGLVLSSLNVKYRDFRFLIPFVVQFGLYVSPVGFSSSIVPEEWRLLYSMNPAVGVIDGFRWCLLRGEAALYWPGFLVSLGMVLLFLWWGISSFRATEKTFADLV